MLNKKLALLTLLLITLFASCQKGIETNEKLVRTDEVVEIKEAKKEKQHPYGGWSCPDNLRGFPPVNVQDIDNIPVVTGRLPTKEETQNGTSLMYFDTTKYPDAKPLDIELPKLARYYSEYTKKKELVVLIQVVLVNNDTVAGFRYLNGGNGSDWYRELHFVSEEEIKELGETPFVSQTININAAKTKIWELITHPSYAKTLGAMFDENAFVESDWQEGSKVYFKYEPNMIVNTGVVTTSWKNMYIQVDYDFDDYHYAEKFLILEDRESRKVSLQVVAGPYSEADFEAKKVVWNNWLKKVKDLSEQYNILNFEQN